MGGWEDGRWETMVGEVGILCGLIFDCIDFVDVLSGRVTGVWWTLLSQDRCDGGDGGGGDDDGYAVAGARVVSHSTCVENRVSETDWIVQTHHPSLSWGEDATLSASGLVLCL